MHKESQTATPVTPCLTGISSLWRYRTTASTIFMA